MPTPASEERRRDWDAKIHAQKASGLSIEKWCRQNQIKSSAFYYWKERLESPSLTRSSFAEIPQPPIASVSIEFRQCRIRLSHFDAAVFRSCIAALKEALC